MTCAWTPAQLKEMKEKRRIIQITAAGHENVSTTQCNLTLFALCNDGTVWEMQNGRSNWMRVPDIPED